MSKKPSFILGAGAQKAGTTWLHRVINQQPHADLGMLKEYHTWDALYSPLCSDFLVNEDEATNPEEALRSKLQNAPENYRDYFLSLVSDSVGITGDITPSYCLLEPTHLIEIQNLMCDFQIKVVFLMRDPVERIWSMMRMGWRRSGKDMNCLDSEAASQLLIKWIREPYAYERTNYPRIIKTLNAVFPAESIFYGFYESLFMPHQIEALASFLGIEIGQAAANRKVNASPVVPLSVPARKEARDYLSDIYDYCAKEFPETLALWDEQSLIAEA